MDIIHWLQVSHTPLLDSIWGAITQLSSEDFLLILLPIVFWCINARTGWLLFTLLMTSVIGEEVLKAVIATPRPDPQQVRVLMPETADGLSFPSAHAQNTTVVFGFIAAQLKRRIAWLAAGVVILLVGVSRLYLGLHWPVDVLGGFVIGAVLLALALRVYTRWSRRLDHPSLWLIAGLVVPVMIFVAVPTKYTAVAAGCLTGMNIGYLVLLPRFGGTFPVRVPLTQQIAKIVIGLLGILLLRTVLKSLFPQALVFDAVRYAVIGLWAGFLAPILFRRLFAAQPAVVAQGSSS